MTTEFIPHSKPTITSEDLAAVEQQLSSNLLAKGRLTETFEASIASFNQVSHSLCTASGSAALQLILTAMNLPAASEIIIPSYVCKSVFNSIVAVGHIPVLCDTGAYWIMTAETIQAAITKNTKAIVLVHTFGIDAWSADLQALGIPVIEDFCQGFGLQIQTRRSLNGFAGFCSFNATKCLTTGEGGAILTNNKALYDAAQQLARDQKIPSLLSDYQSALGISQLNRYPAFLSRRKTLAQNYREGIRNKAWLEKINTVWSSSLFFRFPLTVEQSVEGMITKAAQHQLALRRGVDAVLHQPASAAKFPNTQASYNGTVSLPIYPSLTDAAQEKIIDFINAL